MTPEYSSFKPEKNYFIRLPKKITFHYWPIPMINVIQPRFYKQETKEIEEIPLSPGIVALLIQIGLKGLVQKFVQEKERQIN